MNTNEMTREQISALADGEVLEAQLDSVLAALRHADGKKDWDIYHQIGDVLRSDDMDIKLSSGFAANFAARLEAEPTIIAPGLFHDAGSERDAARVAKARRWALPSVAGAAAMAAFAFFATPQLMVALKGGNPAETSTQVASTPETGSIITASAPEGVILRDPRIDDYLMAHQRISPSLYSTAQFARSANFASDSNK